MIREYHFARPNKVISEVIKFISKNFKNMVTFGETSERSYISNYISEVILCLFKGVAFKPQQGKGKYYTTLRSLVCFKPGACFKLVTRTFLCS